MAAAKGARLPSFPPDRDFFIPGRARTHTNTRPAYLSAARLCPTGQAEPAQVDADSGRDLERGVEARHHPRAGCRQRS